MKKIFAIILSTLFLPVGCSKEPPAQSQPPTETTSKQSPIVKTLENSEEKDFSDCFKNIKGCAVIYSDNEKKFTFYNKTNCNERTSPYSTFKIVAAITALKENIITADNSIFKYSNKKYPFETWEKDLNLKEAFKASCVWYFRQLIDKIGKDKMLSAVNSLNYGNCDISCWEGSNINADKELNGFWLASSLEISPNEQIEVLKKIFDKNSPYSEENINTLKDIMYVENTNLKNISVYGKTGTGKDNIGWFVGFFEKENKKYYFAVRINDKTAKEVTGGVAKEILLNIISKYYQ